MESTECGVASALFSLAKAAAVTCAIMKPEFNPGSGVKKAGNRLVSGLVICSMRRSAEAVGVLHARVFLRCAVRFADFTAFVEMREISGCAPRAGIGASVHDA